MHVHMHMHMHMHMHFVCVCARGEAEGRPERARPVVLLRHQPEGHIMTVPMYVAHACRIRVHW